MVIKKKATKRKTTKKATKKKVVKKKVAKKKTTETVDPLIGHTIKPITPGTKPTEPVPIPLPIVRVLAEMYYDFQNTRIRSGNRAKMNLERNMIPIDDLAKYGVDEIFGNSKKLETDIEKRVSAFLQTVPYYTDYLVKIRGMAAVLSAGLIAWIQSPAKFANISKLHQNAGLGANQWCTVCEKWVYNDIEIEKTNREGKITKTKAKRMSGKVKICNYCDSGEHLISQPQTKAAGLQVNWNPKLKTHCWKIGESFVKQKASKAGYRAIYDWERKKLDDKYPETQTDGEVRGKKRLQHNPKHHFEAAKRHTVKKFLGHMWMVWRIMEGLEVRLPFMPNKEKHQLIPPFVDEGELPKVVIDKLEELNKESGYTIYPRNLKFPEWVPRVDKSKKDDAETQKLNEAPEDESD